MESLRADVDAMKGQLDINKIEAQSQDKFNTRWRPFIGWICGVAFGYATILEPLARFIASVVYRYAGPFPVINTELSLQVLLALLGLGGLRTFERVKGVTK